MVIVDGSFLQKPILADQWDIVIWLDASFDAAEQRGAARDAEAFGGYAAALEAFRNRYHQAQRRYLAEHDPRRTAAVVVNVEDPAHPVLIR